jgi:mannose-6-phosphate isomerase-like protein (cupin superfamily)
MSLRPVRRIVTTNDQNGRSRILKDGYATNTFSVLTELWITDGGPARYDGDEDNAERSKQLEPPAGGTLFRYFEIEPESASAHLSEEERQAAGAAWFASMNGTHLQPDTRRHPGMHKTPSVDYIILLSGQITLVLDDEEVDLKPFDAVVQRGTNHAWVNRGNEPALLMAVLVSALPS